MALAGNRTAGYTAASAAVHGTELSPRRGERTNERKGLVVADQCVSGIKACRLRIVRLDACGTPVVGPKSVVTSKGFISVTSAADIEDGQEFLVKDACGDLCINEKDCPRFKRLTLGIKFCVIDSAAAEIATGNRVQVDGSGGATGFTVGENVDCDNYWSLELWQKVAGQPCDINGDPLWMYWAWPYLQTGSLGNFTFENAAFEFDIDGVVSKGVGDGTWGDSNRGPYAVLSATEALLKGEHLSATITSTQPPAAVCGYQSYAGATPVAPSAPIMELAARASATSATVEFDPSASDGGSPITGYTATSSPGGLTGTSAGSPITVAGLTTGTAYTFTVKATNAVGDSVASAASNSVTP